MSTEELKFPSPQGPITLDELYQLPIDGFHKQSLNHIAKILADRITEQLIQIESFAKPYSETYKEDIEKLNIVTNRIKQLQKL